MDFKRYFFIVFMWQMYLIYLRKALILVSGLGIFLRVLGRGGPFSCVCFLIAVFWQNHYNVGFLWERGGLEHQAGPFSPGSIPSFPSFTGGTSRSKHPFSRAAFAERSSSLSPQHHCQTPSRWEAARLEPGAPRHGTGILALSSPYLFGSVP